MESPAKAVETLNSVKKHFANLLKRNGEILKVNGKDYVKYDGWLTIATVMGIMPRIIDLQATADGYQAKAEAIVIKTGVVVGTAFGICSKTEPNQKGKADHMVAAMAQTRAAARALKSILGGVITHIGYQGEVAEVIEGEIEPLNGTSAPKNGIPKEDAKDDPRLASDKQVKAIHAILSKKGIDEDMVKGSYGVESMTELTKDQASEIITKYGGQ